MAAPSHKPSPSSKPVASGVDSSDTNKPMSESPATTDTATASSPPIIKLKDPPPTLAATDAPTSAPTHSSQEEEQEPTYQSSQASTDFVAAKVLLNQGAFEDALTQIEQGIANTRHMLASLNKTEDEITFHPALAPFHYLYGTTLLYAVEESTDDAMGLTNPAANQDEQQQGGGTDEDNVEDIQVAWENLDLARTILEQHYIMSKNDNNNNDSHEYALDLAQIYLRQGDLHKMNGRYGPAVADYQACLKYRTQELAKCPFDRKIADAHYNLALSHMMVVAEQQQQQAAPNDDAAAVDPTTDTPPTLPPAALKEHLERSVHHYIECARTFCGILAILCQQDPNEFLQQLDKMDGSVAAATASFKTTGEDEQDSNNSIRLKGDASRQLAKLRQHVQQNLQPPTAEVDLESKAEFEELCQLLTEIQETIDEAENSVKGVHQVAEMKAEISAAAAASADDDCNGSNKGQTNQPPQATSNAFGSTAAAASTAVAHTIMAVKKKPKKRPANAVQDAATKRPKSAE